jgi:membrane protease YdiL (CAAX protease family)
LYEKCSCFQRNKIHLLKTAYIFVPNAIRGGTSLRLYLRSERKVATLKYMPGKTKEEHGPLVAEFRIWAWVLLLWSLYRYFLKLPEAVDEFIFKPIIFLGPVLYYLKKVEKRPFSSLGITTKNLFPSLYIGIGIGFLFAIEGILANVVKNGNVLIAPIAAFKQYGFGLLIISVVTAFVEETFARGFLFSRFLEKSKDNLPYAAIYTTAMFVALHVPVMVLSLHYQGLTLVLYFFTNIAIGLANAVIFRQTKSIVAPVLIHLFWNMTMALYL